MYRLYVDEEYFYVANTYFMSLLIYQKKIELLLPFTYVIETTTDITC